jgi:hypothetical protein
MIGENTHLSQTVESFEAIGFLTDGQDLTGTAKIKITVLNDWSVSVKTFGVKHELADLRNDVVTKLEEAGFNVDRLSLEL